ncbi:MAG: EAL domain-containing protein [Acidobacteria bacterium]|nr:EAL domain-containing protein [Acidobacteriota bacterium]
MRESAMKPTGLHDEVILILMQNDFMSKMISAQLRRHHYPSSSATDFDHTAITLKQQNIDLLLLDSELLGIDGFEALRRLRAIYTKDELPIIMLTPQNHKEQVGRSLSLGANDFITKPIDLNIAIARIEIQMALKRATKALRESEERYALALEGSSDGIWDWDFVKDKVFFSPRWKAMLGHKEHEISDSIDDWFTRIHPDDRQRVNRSINDYLSRRTSQFAAEYRILHKEGRYVWCLARATARFGSDGSPYRLVGSQTDITRRGIHDDLTGLPGREIFLERIANAISRVREPEMPYFAVHEVELLRFQELRTSFGDQLADQLLLAFVERLQNTLSPRETLARLESSQFVILQDDLAEPIEAEHLGARIIEATRVPVDIASQRVVLRTRIGLTVAEPPLLLPEDVLLNAHAALINAARNDRTIDVFNPNMRETVVERVELEMELRHALERHEFHLVYQPKFKVQTLALSGVEVLIRWNHPSYGPISPARFIPVAEACGEIVNIGNWVLEKACETAAKWQNQGLPPVRLAVNLSGVQLKEQNVVDHIAKILKKTNFDPTMLDIELTESMLLDNQLSQVVLKALVKLGCGIHIDDFGTGYSSLSYLAYFPIDAIKIDRSFVNGIDEHADKHTIVDAIIAMAKHMGRKVIAEGVETQNQFDMLESLGCHEIQGYLLGKPMPAEAIEELLMKKTPIVAHPKTNGKAENL